MMPSTTIRSQVIDTVVALLGGQQQSAYRCRMSAFTPAQLPADNVIPESEAVAPLDNISVERTFRFFIRHEAVAVDQVDLVAEARYLRAVGLILADPTLGGLVLFTREIGCKWERERGELDTVALVVTYEVQFSTTRSDPGQSL